LNFVLFVNGGAVGWFMDIIAGDHVIVSDKGIIVELLPLSSQRSCLSVSRLFHDLAMRPIFSVIKLYHDGPFHVDARGRLKMLDRLANDRKFAMLVRKLVVFSSGRFAPKHKSILELRE
jgi:hypothetical protein